MDTDLRASLAAAGAAAALSALIGLVAGVGALALVLRALGCGVVLGAAVFGGLFLVRRNLPGLLSADEAGGAREEGQGSKVDIVLPEEGVSSESYGSVEGAWSPTGERPLRDSGAKDAASDKGESLPAEAASLLEPEEAEPAGAALPTAQGPGKERRASTSFDDLDVLPDLDGFGDAFAASEFVYGGSGGGAGGLQTEGAARPAQAPAGAGASRVGQEGLDPASLAQAVRTIMKRDQKG